MAFLALHLLWWSTEVSAQGLSPSLEKTSSKCKQSFVSHIKWKQTQTFYAVWHYLEKQICVSWINSSPWTRSVNLYAWQRSNLWQGFWIILISITQLLWVCSPSKRPKSLFHWARTLASWMKPQTEVRKCATPSRCSNQFKASTKWLACPVTAWWFYLFHRNSKIKSPLICIGY